VRFDTPHLTAFAGPGASALTAHSCPDQTRNRKSTKLSSAPK